MTISVYYACDVCGSVCNLKYQMGYSKKHPIRYKCSCGVSVRGMYEADKGISFENAKKCDCDRVDLVVYCSGEFFTIPPFAVNSYEETVGAAPPPFIMATMLLNYKTFSKEFDRILDYRDHKRQNVRAVNELYNAGNTARVKEVIRRNFDPKETLFPLENKADYLRATTMINQFQFLSLDGKETTKRITTCIVETIKKSTKEFNEFIAFVKKLGTIESWKKRIYKICDQVYEKVDLLMPAVSIDFLKNDKIDLNAFAITTTSFEEIKQLYVDLYELIGDLLVLALGVDNINCRKDYRKLKQVDGLNVNDIEEVSRMRNKGNILKLIDEDGQVGSLICNILNSDIRNSIGHYSYSSNEIADSYGQTIVFENPYSKEVPEKRSLLQICYDIWHMYKSLGIFNEIIHHIEIQLLAKEGIHPSFMNNPDLFKRLTSTPKVYPNDPCPCGSGLKYKKCCGRNI
jgi:hypothetical protein